MFVCVCYNRCHGNAIMGFFACIFFLRAGCYIFKVISAVWDNIYYNAHSVLHIFPFFFTGNLLVL